MTLKLETTTTKLRKGWNLSWYHHLTHIACVQKLRGLRKKLDALRVQTGPSLSKYNGFIRKLICLKAFHFSKLISTQDFLCIQHMQHSKQHTKILTLSDLICYFSCI